LFLKNQEGGEILNTVIQLSHPNKQNLKSGHSARDKRAWILHQRSVQEDHRRKNPS